MRDKRFFPITPAAALLFRYAPCFVSLRAYSLAYSEGYPLQSRTMQRPSFN